MRKLFCMFMAVASIYTTAYAALIAPSERREARGFSCTDLCTGKIMANVELRLSGCEVLAKCKKECVDIKGGLTSVIMLRNTRVKKAVQEAEGPTGLGCASMAPATTDSPITQDLNAFSCDKDCFGWIKAKPGSNMTDCDAVKQCNYCASEPGLTKKVRNMKIKSAIKKTDPDGSLCRSQIK